MPIHKKLKVRSRKKNDFFAVEKIECLQVCEKVFEKHSR